MTEETQEPKSSPAKQDHLIAVKIKKFPPKLIPLIIIALLVLVFLLVVAVIYLLTSRKDNETGENNYVTPTENTEITITPDSTFSPTPNINPSSVVTSPVRQTNIAVPTQTIIPPTYTVVPTPFQVSAFYFTTDSKTCMEIPGPGSYTFVVHALIGAYGSGTATFKWQISPPAGLEVTQSYTVTTPGMATWLPDKQITLTVGAGQKEDYRTVQIKVFTPNEISSQVFGLTLENRVAGGECP